MLLSIMNPHPGLGARRWISTPHEATPAKGLEFAASSSLGSYVSHAVPCSLETPRMHLGALTVPLGLPSGRRVLERTSSNRASLLAAFSQWLLEVNWLDLAGLLLERPLDAEKVSDLLVEYGRDLYASGRPYWHFAETVNEEATAGSLGSCLLLASRGALQSPYSHACCHLACSAGDLPSLGLAERGRHFRAGVGWTCDN